MYGHLIKSVSIEDRMVADFYLDKDNQKYLKISSPNAPSLTPLGLNRESQLSTMFSVGWIGNTFYGGSQNP